MTCKFWVLSFANSCVTWWKQETEKLNDLPQRTLLVSRRQDSNLGLLNLKACDLFVIILPEHDIFLKHEWNLFLPDHMLSAASLWIPQATWSAHSFCYPAPISIFIHTMFLSHWLVTIFPNLQCIFMFSGLCSCCFPQPERCFLSLFLL